MGRSCTMRRVFARRAHRRPPSIRLLRLPQAVGGLSPGRNAAWRSVVTTKPGRTHGASRSVMEVTNAMKRRLPATEVEETLHDVVQGAAQHYMSLSGQTFGPTTGCFNLLSNRSAGLEPVLTAEGRAGSTTWNRQRVLPFTGTLRQGASQHCDALIGHLALGWASAIRRMNAARQGHGIVGRQPRGELAWPCGCARRLTDRARLADARFNGQDQHDLVLRHSPPPAGRLNAASWQPLGLACGGRGAEGRNWPNLRKLSDRRGG